MKLDPVFEQDYVPSRTPQRGGRMFLRSANKVVEKSDMLAAQIHKMVRTMSLENRQKKAERHVYDAYYLRTVRNDIDMLHRHWIKIIWRIENNQNWQSFLFILTLIYQGLTFFENPFPDEYENSWIVIIELIILLIMLSDVIVTIILLATHSGPKIKLKRLLKIIICFIYIADLVTFVSNEQNTVRFSRILRPLFMTFYSKDLRRTLSGIYKAIKNLFLLVLIHVLIISIFSFIAINLIGTIPGMDQDTQDYGDFFKMFCMLFFVSTLDYYPDILIAPSIVGQYYIIFFVIYLMLFLFLFQPIPLAVVYEGFRKHRSQIAIDDIIKQKSAMMAAFISLDTLEKGYLSEHQFKQFLLKFYRNQLTQEEQQYIFSQIDKDFNDKIQFDEFFQLISLIQNSQILTMPRMAPLPIWEKFREVILKMGLKKLLQTKWLPNFMMIVTLVNCSMIVASLGISDQTTLELFNQLDTAFLIIFATECLIKIIGMGIRKYFDDSWYYITNSRNVFDISLVVLQTLFDYVLFSIIQGNVAQSVKANRILRLAKIQKVFRLFRAFRSIKLLSFLMSGLEIFSDVRDLVYKIMMCVPVILRLLLPIQIVFFMYSVIGMYMYGQMEISVNNPYGNPQCALDPDEIHYQWQNCSYAQFNTLSGSYLLLLQVFIASQWGQLIYELEFQSGSLALPMLYLGSYVFLSIFMMALIGGLVWEVFIVVSLSMRNTNVEEEELYISQDGALLSSVGSLNEQRYAQTTQQTTLNKLQKKTLILNDDNPEEINIKARAESIQKAQKSMTHDDKYHIPEENRKINIERYQMPSSRVNSGAPIWSPEILDSAENQDGPLINEATSILEVYLQAFIEFDTFLTSKLESGLSIVNVAQEYTIHLRNEIKKDEIFQIKTINIQNQDMLIQNAVLRDTNELQIRQQEDKHFKQLYGPQFEKLKDLKFQSKFKIESKILFSLMGILKFPKITIKYYFQILFLIENQLTYQLLPDFSFWKMIHLIDGNWYMITFEERQIAFTQVKKGPWHLADRIFTNQHLRICENLNFLKDSQDDPGVRYLLKQFQQSIGQIANTFDIDHSQIHRKSTFVLYDIPNQNYMPPTRYQRKSQLQKNFTLSVDESPKKSMSEKQNYAQRSMMLVLSKNQGLEEKTQYQNQVLLLQFIQDIGHIIQSYSKNYFQQLESLYLLRLKC